MGESIFAQWCAAQGIKANSSKVDKTGWDFLIEFGFQPLSQSDPSMIHVGAYECKVQVKSTDSQERQCSVKLSNLRRMVTAGMPCFFLFIEFDGLENAQRAYLRHVDEELCTKVLRRIHDEDLAGRGGQLHQRKMLVKYDESNRLTTASGGAMVSALQGHLLPTAEDYIARKIAHVASTGFEEGRAALTFAVAEEDMENFVDMTLGIDTQLTVSNVEGVAKRFGKRSQEAFIKEASATLQFIPFAPDFKGHIKFRTDKLGPFLSLPGKLHISGLIALLPKQLAKVRVESDFCEFIFNPSGGVGNYTFKAPPHPIPLHQLLDGLRTIEMLTQTEREIEIQIDMPPLKRLTFKAHGQHGIFPYERALYAAQTGLQILNALGPSHGATMSLAQAQHYAARIAALNELLKPDSIAFKPSFSLPRDQLPNVHPPLYLMFYLSPVGNMVVGVFLTLTGTLVSDGGDRYSFLGSEKTVERVVSWERGAEVDTQGLIDIMTALEEKYEDTHYVLIANDKRSFKKLNQPPQSPGEVAG